MGLATRDEVVILTGGTGGAKLARGLAEAVAPERVVAVANTGDDIEIYGAYVAPDPDLVCFWLADTIDERGWGLREDTFAVMEALRALGTDVWFNLGDRDLAWCLERARMLADGLTPTQALAHLTQAIGVGSRVLPMSDQPVRTWIRTAHLDWLPFQEFMIRERAAGQLTGVRYEGAETASPSEEVLAAIAGASSIVIGPSNPLASIAPILALKGMREALAESPAPVLAVSPIVGGEVLKGPTAPFLAFAGVECSAGGVCEYYGELLDGVVADEEVPGVPTLRTDTNMPDGPARARLAEQTLSFAATLA